MSPTPIIDLQRRLALVGAVRAGGEKPERGVGAKLDAYRLTSPRRELIEQAAQLYGGDVTPWQSPVGQEWQCYTTSEELPVLVMPGYSLQQSYELWEGTTKRTRKCDGVEDDVSGGPCVCNAEGVDRCDLYTRLVVALPELDTALGWRLITRGANAAHELPTMMALIEARAGGAAFVPARIRIAHRRGVKDGQTVRYVVPVLDLGLSYLDMAGAEALQNGPRAPLPSSDVTGYQPATRALTSTSDAVGALSAPRSGLGPRIPPMADPSPADFNAEPAPPVDVEQTPDAPPVEQTPPPPSQFVAPEDVPFGNEPTATTPQSRHRTEPQATKLNVLIGKLRTPGHITTDGLYKAVAQMRGVGGLELANSLGGYDENHVLHWSPLRDSLDRAEANMLIDRLAIMEARIAGEQA